MTYPHLSYLCLTGTDLSREVYNRSLVLVLGQSIFQCFLNVHRLSSTSGTNKQDWSRKGEMQFLKHTLKM